MQKINHEIIENLQSLGFKVVPISSDGVTPCIPWTEIYDNGCDVSKLVKVQFTNTATCFGKSHIKDENNRDLYLNCLDIDSKEVFDRLCIILDKNKKERFLITELQRRTFVTKTRKEYGYHIYWSSHTLNVPIHRNNCKPGFEFEIKTDNTSGLAALPDSRHRDDADFHYRNIGQNKIMISDSLYGEIVRILDDCIINEYNSPRYNKISANRQLNERDIEKISDSLSIIYIRGFRHDICYAISGILYKNGIGLETTSKIINSIGKHDEEAKSRLAVMRHTYSKVASEVSGRNQLLQTLKSVCNDDKQAGDILLSILRILNPSVYEPLKIEHNKVAQELIEEYHFKTIEDTDELYYYNDTTHRYTSHGDVLVRKELELLFPEISTRNVNEILQKIKRKNPINREEFDTNPYIVSLQNGLLDTLTGKLISHSPEFLNLIQLPIKYDRKAKCPKIMDFLAQVLRPCDIFTFIQFIGYCLIKSSKYEKSLILLGKGDNGKTVLLKLVEIFLGRDNVSHESLKQLNEDKYSKAELFGKMANICGDLESHKIIDISSFKQLVSGDTVSAQKKYQNPFCFRNYARLLFSSNYFPNVSNAAYTFHKRVIAMPCLATFLDDKDVNKIDELTTQEELSGLLNLALIGLKQLIKLGNFGHVEDIRSIKQLFENSENNIANFVSERCIRDSLLREKCVHVYREYSKYCRTRGKSPLSDNSFGVYLHDMGIQKGRQMLAGVRYYIYKGIKLKAKKIA
jgi:putative DNA primase/helicase